MLHDAVALEELSLEFQSEDRTGLNDYLDADDDGAGEANNRLGL